MKLLFNTLMKFSSPMERFNAVIKNKTPIMTESFPFGVITYYRGSNDRHMIRLQIAESTPKYVKIVATAISIDEHKKNAEALAYGVIQDRYIKESLIGVVSTVEEINLFLKDVWNKFGWKPDPGVGSKWQRADFGYKRLSDGKIFPKSRFQQDAMGYFIFHDSGGKIISFHENDLID